MRRQNFGEAAPFSACKWDKIDKAADPGDFNLCLTPTTETCLLYGCDWPKCQGLTQTILAQPSTRWGFSMQLVVYTGFLLVCVWTILEEADQKLHISAALRLRRVYHDRSRRRDWHWWARSVIVTGFLWVLAGTYAWCLQYSRLVEDFYIFSRPQDLQDRSRYNVSMLGPGLGLHALAKMIDAKLVWYCDAGELAQGSPSVLHVTYALGSKKGIAMAVAAGLYFFYTCYSLLARQRTIYSFMDINVILHNDMQVAAAECSYWSIHEIRDSGTAMDRDDVGAYLCRSVYLAFLRKVYYRRPNILHSLFNEADVDRLVRAIEERDDDDTSEVKEGRTPADRASIAALSVK